MSRADEGGSSTTKVVLIVVGIVGGIIVLGVVACAGLGYFMVRSASQAMGTMMQMVNDVQASQVAAQRFMGDLAAGQTDEAYAQTTAGFKGQMTREKLRKFVDDNPALKNHVVNGMQPTTVAPPVIYYQETLSGPKGPTTCTLRVIKENEQWKVDLITIP